MECFSIFITANEEMCKLLGATKIPYILVYKRVGGKIAGFTCPPSQVQLLIDVLHEHAVPTNPSTLEVESELEMEEILSQGSALLEDFISDIQEESGFKPDECPLSFEEFCAEHTHQKKSLERH